MKFSTLRSNVLALAGLYGVCLVATALCPNRSASAPSGSPDRTVRPTISLLETTASAADNVLDDRAKAEKTIYDDKHQPVDPIKINGKYFEDWKTPKLAVVITGKQDGYMEPCGCAGIENQKGGLARRATFLKELKAKGWPVTAIDLGGFVRRFGIQAENQLGLSAAALEKMGYGAAGFGPRDLRMPDTLMLAAVEHPNLFVGANYRIDETEPYRIISAGGMTIGVTSVLGEKAQKEAGNGVKFTPDDKALKAIMPKLEKCDARILLAYATKDEAIVLAAKFPQFDYIVDAGGDDEPLDKPIEIVDAKTKLIEVGHKGMFAIVLGFYGQDEPVKYQRVALDTRYKNAPEMIALMKEHQDYLESLGWKGLGVKPTPYPVANPNDPPAKFVGAVACKKCHEEAYVIWTKTKHAKATETLAKLNPPRLHDPECVSCHVTGWNPQEYFPYTSGFLSEKETPNLVGNGCENCHGPASAHVAAESGGDKKLQTKLREELGEAARKDNMCAKCHDGDNSPMFNYAKYWKAIEH